jgi:hypothetical protein
MTFGSNVRDLIDYVYGEIKVDEDAIANLESSLRVEDEDAIANLESSLRVEDEEEDVDDFVKMQAVNSLFKQITFQLLNELNRLEREYGGKLRIRQPTGLNLSDNVRMDEVDLDSLVNENKLIDINNLKLKIIIDKMKENISE